MKTDKLTQLLEAFYNGTTTTEEEQLLYQHFTSATILSEEMEAEKRTFLSLYYLSAEDETEVPSLLNDKLSSLIDSLSEKKAPERKNILLRRFSAVAASLLLLIAVGLYVLDGRQTQPMLVDTFTNPEEAYAETQRTLELISSALNDGVKPLKEASEGISMVNRLVNESFGKIK